ncbi:MAG: preprotein translocase subunit SecG [Polyangiaceae bacterium]
MFVTLIDIVHILVCVFLMLVVLLQQGKGGGMGAAFGGGGASQVFGGSGAGNILTRATAIAAGLFMLTSVSLAYFSSSGDRALKTKMALEEKRRKEHGIEKAPKPGATGAPASTGAGMTPPAGSK